jgi:hypothetical protein
MAIKEGKRQAQVINSMQVCLPNILAMVLAFEIYARRKIFVSLL